jgi:hypothetical protein
VHVFVYGVPSVPFGTKHAQNTQPAAGAAQVNLNLNNVKAEGNIENLAKPRCSPPVKYFKA